MVLCKDDIKKLIMEQAKYRFDRFGYKKTTMDEISKDCRISKKTIYSCFKDKEQLFDCLLLYESRKAKNYIFAKTQETDDSVEQLKFLMKATVKYFSKNRFLIRILNDEQSLYPSSFRKKCSQEVEEALMPLVIGILNRGQQNRKIRDIDVSSVAYVGLKMFECYIKTCELEQETEKFGYSVKVLIDLVLQGLLQKEVYLGRGG